MKLVTKQIYCFARVGFIGLGNMGMPMAANLAKNNHQVSGFDVDSKKEEICKSSNVEFTSSVKNLAQNFDIFVAMLPNSSFSKDVCESEGGIFKNAKKGSLIIDCSTISPMVAAELSDKAKSLGMTYVDAPVSGGVTGAAAATLTFMVGSQNNQIFERCKPILEGMGKNFFNCQKASGGQIAKLCNNMSLAIQMIGIAESLAVGKKLGMNQKILAQIMSVSSARCWSVDTYNPIPGYFPNNPSGNNYQGGFACDLMLKDLGLALEASQVAKVQTKMGNLSKQVYKQLSDSGYGKKDFGIIYKELSKQQ